MIIKLNPKNIPQVALIHNQELHGLLSEMGEAFLIRFYKVSLSIPEMFTLVALQNNQILGFASSTLTAKGLYKKIIIKDILAFNLLFLRNFVTHPQLIPKFIKIYTYPGFSDNFPELLSIAVVEKYQNRGIGRKLFDAVSQEFQKRGYKSFKVSVYEGMPANDFYLKMGCKLDRSFNFIDETMNCYLYNIKQ